MFVIETAQVHLWWLNLDQLTLIDDPASVVNAEERERAARFRFVLHQERWIRARASLRIVLGRYLSVPPETIVFSYGKEGKPEISSHSDSKGLCFNVSHSAGLCGIAVTQLDCVGINVEEIRIIPEALEIARASFTRGEYAALLATPSDTQARLFLRLWTEKEAYLKALGLGLGGYPKLATEAFAEDGLGESNDEISSDPAWHKFEVDPGPEYCASLVLRAEIRPNLVTYWLRELRNGT